MSLWGSSTSPGKILVVGSVFAPAPLGLHSTGSVLSLPLATHRTAPFHSPKLPWRTEAAPSNVVCRCAASFLSSRRCGLAKLMGYHSDHIAPDPFNPRARSFRDGKLLSDGPCELNSGAVSGLTHAWTDLRDHPVNGVYTRCPIEVIKGWVEILPEWNVAACANKPVIGPVVTVPGEIAHGPPLSIPTPQESHLIGLRGEVDVGVRDREGRQAPLFDSVLLQLGQGLCVPTEDIFRLWVFVPEERSMPPEILQWFTKDHGDAAAVECVARCIKLLMLRHPC